MKDPAAVAQKWKNNLTNSVGQIKAGVQAVTVSPTAKAAKQAEAYVAGVQQAVASQKWQNSLNNVSLQQWQQATLDKGVPRIATGAQNALPKFQEFMSQWLPYEQSVKDRLASMPRGTPEQNIQRAVYVMQENAKFKKR